ncbi:MAG: 50S ribosomal protein L4 [Bacteroidales bacterium]|nr:50S ribosomal protein L4 [Bacteroidales bacterium]HNW73867.1 50S ribosomal protein L4 [Bacteroidales bacterium]HPS50107.1 50S ribosomal protein L4 [Bacteroidales bacterium]
MEVAIYNIKGTATAQKVMLDDSVFAIEPNDHAIYLDVKQYLANQRQGTHSSLEKSVVSGSTKKLHKQKGTGGSRKGSIKNPLYRGGARIFGPQPRDYSFKLNKKLKKLARKSALSYKIKDEQLTILENFSFETPKTKNFTELMKNFQLVGKKVLLVVASPDENIILAARNLKRVKVMNAAELNTYDILNATRLLITEGSIKEIEKIHQN